MFNKQQIVTAFQGGVGWRNSSLSDVDLVEVDSLDLTSSSSMLYFNDEHPMLDMENIVSVCPDYSITETNQANENLKFSTWLKERTDSGIIQAITDWYNKKLNVKTGNSLIERKRVFQNAGSLSSLDINDGSRVFLEHVFHKSKFVKIKGLKIGFQFLSAESFTFSIFQKGKSAAVHTQSIDHSGSGELLWFDLDYIFDGGETYYLSYDQSEINSQSINGMNVDNFVGHGSTLYPSSDYVSTVSGKAPQGTTTTFWDVSRNIYSGVTNYGINLEYSVYCDYTDFIIENKESFYQLIAVTVATRMLHRIAFNPQARTDRNNRNADTKTLLYELDGDSQGRPGGLKLRYKEAFEALQFDLNQIDSVCLKCRKKTVLRSRVG